jgi:acyl carrier protein
MATDNVFQVIREILVDSLGVTPEEVTLESYLIDDLGAESIDLLDVFYQAEKRLGIRISEADIAPEFRPPPDANEEWEPDVNRELTAEELQVLRERLPPSAHERIVPGLCVYEIVRLFNVECLVNFLDAKVVALKTAEQGDGKETDG